MEVLIEKVKFKSQFKDNKLTYIFTTKTSEIIQVYSSHSFNTGKEISNMVSLHKLDNVDDIIEELKTNYSTLHLEVEERTILDWIEIETSDLLKNKQKRLGKQETNNGNIKNKNR